METITLREFRETGAKYKKLRKRLDKRIKNGSFYKLTKRKQRNLVYRVRKLYEKLLRLKNLLKLATAGAAMSLMLTTGQADAQNFHGKLPFKGEFKSVSAVKTYESDLFIQMLGSNNPFSGTNPFESNIIENAGYANFVDIDNDGDLDVFSYHLNNISNLYSVIYYKNTGDNNNVILEQQYGPDNPGDDAVFGSRPYISFVDIDNDGDLDVFIGDQDNNEILYFKNIGSPENPYFVPKTGADNPLDGVSPQSMDRLSFADIDNDDDLDVFIGTFNNYPYLYRNTGDAENPAFTPEDASSFFNSTLSWLESMLLKDLDGDGDLDAIINGSRYFENQGNASNPNFVEIIGSSNPLSGINNLSWNLPDLIDLDSDSDLDLIFGSYNKIEYYKNTGNSSSAIFENTSGGIDSTYYTMPEFVDIDNDGDFDMFVGIYNENAYAFMYAYYKNTGTSENPVFEKQAWTDNPLNADTALTFIPVLKFADIDNDGDFDVFTAGYGGSSDLRYFKNTGTADAPVFEEQTGGNNPFNGLSNILDLDFVDIDNDGDLDCFMGILGQGMDFYRNTGTASAPVFTSEASPVTIPDTWYYLFPEFADIDNDGDFDLIAGGFDYDLYQWEVLYAENKGTADTPDFKAQYGNANPLNLSFYVPGIAFADIDNDGDQDCFIGTLGGSIYYFKNKTVSAGIENAATDNSLSVYPNPASNEIRIDLSSFGSEDVNISVFDITGKIVSSYILKDKNTINVSNLKSGVYFIKARDNKHSETAEFIKK